MTQISSSDDLACMVCAGPVTPFMSKHFHGDCGLNEVQYDRCNDCGFVFSRTHFLMDDATWSGINEAYHLNYFQTDNNPDDPRWLERINAQREAIATLYRAGSIPAHLGAYDYGCGDGKLADLVTASAFKVCKYDRYIAGDASDYLTDEDIEAGGFGLVINTSVMEHVRDLETLDAIARSVDPREGILAIHTLVAEHVPQDPDWFYLLPVHLAFFTNRAMEILTERWGFRASVYAVAPRMWFLFRDEEQAQQACEVLRGSGEAVSWKAGFVDYWQ